MLRQSCNCQNFGKADKNHWTTDHPFNTTGERSVYATNTTTCPVSFKKYKTHLNEICKALWQCQRSAMNSSGVVCYANVPLDEKYLGEMLLKLSIKWGLSQRYTNDCLAVTSLQILDDGNIDTLHTINVSGHKQTDSLQNYARRLLAARK